MRLSFDGQLLLKGEKTGIPWCAENMLQQFAKDATIEKQFTCFTMGISEEEKKEIVKYQQAGYEMDTCSWFRSSLYRMLWTFLPVPHALFFRKKADISIFFNFVVPPGVKGKVITYVHDMAYKAYPQTVRKKTRWLLQLSLKASCKRADRIITVSEFSKQELMKYLGVEESKIKVIPNAVDHALYHAAYTPEQIAEAKAQEKVPEQYFFYLGTLEPRKNLERLIVAYAAALKEEPELPALVLAGRKGWYYESIFERVKELKLENKVLFLGYISSEHAALLLAGAVAFVFPSLYEGFGMPPLEAMACGTPVLSADCTSLPEVLGDVAVYVDPLSEGSIKEGLLLMGRDKELRQNLRNRGLERAGQYSWEHAAEMLKTICTELMQESP